MKKIIKKEAQTIIPHWVPEKEKIGSAMMQSGQEALLAVEEVLIREFDFTEKDLKQFHKKLEHILKVTREAEGMGLSCVGIQTIRAMADIAQIRFLRDVSKESGILLPQQSKKEIVTKLLSEK